MKKKRSALARAAKKLTRASDRARKLPPKKRPPHDDELARLRRENTLLLACLKVVYGAIAKLNTNQELATMVASGIQSASERDRYGTDPTWPREPGQPDED